MGDIFFIDISLSCFEENKVDAFGNIKDGADTNFLFFEDIEELKKIENISFSLKQLIDYCKEYNFEIILFDSDEYSESTIYITPYLPYDPYDPDINQYLQSIK